MENIKKFFEKLSEDETLQARVKAELEGLEGDAKINKIVEIAKENGFNFTADDFATAKKTELTEEDLDNVNGGAWWEYLIPGYNLYAAGRDIYNAIKGKDKPAQPAPAPAPAPAPEPSTSPTQTTGGSGTSYNNTNDGGKQMMNQGNNNNNSNAGSMTW